MPALPSTSDSQSAQQPSLADWLILEIDNAMTQQPTLLHEQRPISSVEEYRFEPIKGYPMLHWRGKRPFTATQYYPAQRKETHGSEVDGWRNKIYWGDNLQVMSHLLKEYRGQVQLVYIDPPFDSKADYKKSVNVRSQSIENEKSAFEEKQYTDIWTNDEYLQFMYERLVLTKELIAHAGSIYLHCDWHKNAYLRAIMDEIFGPERFGAEIVWQRGYAHANATKKYGAVHDTILYYTVSDESTWNQQYTEYPEEYIETFFDQVDGDGRRYARIDLTASMTRASASQIYEWNGITPPPSRCWAKTKENMDKLAAQNRIHWPKKEGGMPRLKQYPEDLKGVPIQDTWTDIRPMHNLSSERIGYPTQKPEALIERIVKTSSNLGDLVFDCFMGAGTTQAVAMKLGRRFIGADINLGAVQITTKRLISIGKELTAKPPVPTQPTLALVAADSDEEEDEAATTPAEPTLFYTGFEVYNVNHYDIFRNPLEARDLLLEALEINRLEAGHLFDGEKDGRMWKLMPVNRIATKADLNDLLANLDYRAFARRKTEHPNRPVERITLVCMGHAPDLRAILIREAKLNGFDIDVEVVDILRDKQQLQFKRDAEASVAVRNGHLVIDAFYPMNLLSKLSLQAESVNDWRELVESIMIDWNYDGAVLQPALVDVPEKNELVTGTYSIPADAGTIRIKITDLLSESLEVEVAHG